MRPLAVANLLTATTEDHKMHHHASSVYVRFIRTMRTLLKQPNPQLSMNGLINDARMVTDSINANLFVSAYSWHRVNGEVRFKRHG